MQNELSVVSLVLNQKTGADLNNAMHGIDGLTHKVQRYQGQQPLGNLARLGALPDVVVLELDNENKESLDDIALFVEKNGEQAHVFVTVQDASVNLVRQLMRNGVRDVLAQPISDHLPVAMHIRLPPGLCVKNAKNDPQPT
jgi:FixJ family two-component response regulator